MCACVFSVDAGSDRVSQLLVVQAFLLVDVLLVSVVVAAVTIVAVLPFLLWCRVCLSAIAGRISTSGPGGKRNVRVRRFSVVVSVVNVVCCW